MGKSKSVTSADTGPGAKARVQKAEAQKKKAAQHEAELKAKEDAEWANGSNRRGQDRENANTEKEEEKRLKALEKKALMAAEDAELAIMKAPKGKARKAQQANKKVDFGALDAFLEEEKKEKELKAKSRSRTGDMIKLSENLNRKKADDESLGIYSASGIDNAMTALDLVNRGDNADLDKHPEKRMKAAYTAFEDRRMNEMKEEMPGLKRQQYKDKIWKEWQKSAENPMNQIPPTS